MAITKGTVAGLLANTLYTDSALTDASSTQAAATPTLRMVKVIGTDMTAPGFLKIADEVTGSIAPDSNNPDFIFYCPSQTTVEYINYDGRVFATALTYWGTSTQANATAQAAPTGTFSMRLLF